MNKNISKIYKLDKKISQAEYKKIEALRIKWQYEYFNFSDYKKELLWRKFAIQFIFESNAIEGSRLSQSEVEAIVKKKYVSKNIDKKEVIEVKNSIKAFAYIRSDKFKLNQVSIKKLHELVTQGLDIEKGYKKVNIVVNNKETVSPQKVRKNMVDLLVWWKEQKKEKKHPLSYATIFHQRFEYIHPFTDGNGRLGRLLFNWMLLQSRHGVILFRHSNRKAYFSALDKADNGQFQKLNWHVFNVYKQTMKNLIPKF